MQVDHTPWRCPLVCPYCVSLHLGKCFLTFFVSMSGHKWEFPFPMAFSHVSSVGCPAAACRYCTVCSMLGSLYTLWMYSSLLVHSSSFVMISPLRLVVCTLYMMIKFLSLAGWSRRGLSVFELLGLSTSGTNHSFVNGNLRPFSTAS